MQNISVKAKDGSIIPAVTVGMEDGDKKAVVIISHGFGEHAGSYIELAEDFRKAGYASIIPDQRGHGKPPDGAKKWHGIIPDYQCFLDDIISLTDTARQTAPDTPIILYGHSMGGNIIANTLLRLTSEQASVYACAVFESPWLGLYDPPGPLMGCMIKFLSRVMPNFIQKQKLSHSDLSSDTERSDGYSKDPLYHGLISMRMANGIIQGCTYALENAARFPVPAYLAYASNDHIVSNKASREFAEKAGAIVTIKEYESNHAIHNDVSREPYINDMVAYIDSRIQGGMH